MACDHTRKESWWVNDARGIPLARVCDKCKEEKLSKFRPEVRTNPNYQADEAIEPDDGVPAWKRRAIENGDYDYSDVYDF